MRLRSQKYVRKQEHLLYVYILEHEIKDICLADSWEEALTKSKSKTVLTIMPLEHGFKGDGYCMISEQDILGEKQNRRKQKKFTSKDFIADIS